MKLAKQILSTSELVFMANKLAKNAIMQEGMLMQINALKSMSLFFIYTAKQMLASTTKHITFVDWQIICSTPKNMDKSGIKNVPPPMPIPANIPEKQEASNNSTTCIFSSKTRF